MIRETAAWSDRYLDRHLPGEAGNQRDSYLVRYICDDEIASVLEL